MKYVISYDIGTTGVKTCIFKLDKNIELIADASNGYPLYTLANGGAEQNPDDWWKQMVYTTKEVFKKCKIKPSQIEGISFCAQMQAVVLVDQSGKPIRRAMSYMDQRATEEVKKGISHGLQIAGANIFKLIPSLVITGAVTSSAKDPVWKLKWVEAHEPEVFKKAYKWLDVKDYLTFRCTGEYTMTEDSAFATLIYDNRPKKGCWSKKLCKMFNIDMNLLAPVIKSTDAIGNGLTKIAAKELGLKVGTKVFGGGGDSSLIGIGAGCTHVGDTHIYCGTSGWVSTITNKRKVDPTNMIAAITGAQHNLFNYFAEMETAGKCFEWVRDHLALDEINVYLKKQHVAEAFEKKYKTLFDYLNEVIKDVPPGSNGVIFTPWLHGNRCPFEDPYSTGMFIGLKINTGKTEMIHAVLEGIYYHLRWMLEKQTAKIKTSETIRFVGGGAMSEVSCQMLADILGKTIETVNNPQNVGSYGAAAICAVGLNVIPSLDKVDQLIHVTKKYTPNKKRHEQYEPYFQSFKKLYKSNKKNFYHLAKKDLKDTDKKRMERMRALKFLLFSLSAGVIQIIVTAILDTIWPAEKVSYMPALAYLLGLVVSIVWNFTFNRKFTFRSANNVPKAMGLAFLFYVFFAPASTYLEAYLTNGDVLSIPQLKIGNSLDLPPFVALLICMVLNFILEFFWQKYVVFRNSIDSNK